MRREYAGLVLSSPRSARRLQLAAVVLLSVSAISPNGCAPAGPPGRTTTPSPVVPTFAVPDARATPTGQPRSSAAGEDAPKAGTPTQPELVSFVGADPSVEGACADFARVLCRSTKSCAPRDLGRRYRDEATCVAREALWCSRELAAEQSGFTLATLAS